MIDRKSFYNVKNRSAGGVSYRIPEDNIYRSFAPGETKRDIPYEELEKLSFQPGGIVLLREYLQVSSQEVVETLASSVEQEYWYSEEEIIKLLEEGSVEALLDCLDFAPTGVIDLVKKYAVDLPVNDFRKREAILKKTGFDVTGALNNLEDEKREEAKMRAEIEAQKNGGNIANIQTSNININEEPKHRRVTSNSNTENEDSKSAEKSSSNYKIINNK